MESNFLKGAFSCESARSQFISLFILSIYVVNELYEPFYFHLEPFECIWLIDLMENNDDFFGDATITDSPFNSGETISGIMR